MRLTLGKGILRTLNKGGAKTEAEFVNKVQQEN
jgi:hypothetical protein